MLAEEKRNGQQFVVDLVIHTDMAKACASDRIEDTVNYVDVAENVRRVMTSEKDNLIERVAQRIADSLLENHPLITTVDITLKKPEAPMIDDLKYVGVEISRTRKLS